ncbi:hypothetical protein FHH43_08800 [Clostridium perfringens]|nr:hypothetical protein [Clostridium perfringens]
MKQKRSKALLVSGILGLIYSLLLIRFFAAYFFVGVISNVDVEKAISLIAVIIVIPHMILFVLATIFNWVSYIKNKRGFALTAGILYLISAIIFPIDMIFIVPSMIFSFIGYFTLKKINIFNKENSFA